MLAYKYVCAVEFLLESRRSTEGRSTLLGRHRAPRRNQAAKFGVHLEPNAEFLRAHLGAGTRSGVISSLLVLARTVLLLQLTVPLQ